MDMYKTAKHWIIGVSLVTMQIITFAAHGQSTWTPTAGVMTTQRDAHSALMIGGLVLVIGGRTQATTQNGATTKRVEYYNPTTSMFTATGSMVSSRSFFPAVLMSDGTVLAPGGFSSTSGSIRAAEIFTPSQGTWAATGSMGSARELHSGTLLPNGNVLVAGASAMEPY